MSFDATIAEKFSEVTRIQDDMHLFQGEASDFLIRNPFSALFVDLGLGKTIISLTAISYLLELDLDEKILIIGPVRVCTDVWPTEIASWRHTAWMNHVLIRVDDDDPRLKAARDATRVSYRALGASQADIEKACQKSETRERHRIMGELAHDRKSIHIINREQVEWLTELYGAKWPYRIVFVDESSSFKDHSTLRFKALAKVRRTPGLIVRLHILTATPAAETYEHLFAQIYLLDLGKRLGKNITAFRDEFFTYNRWSMKWKLREGREETILSKISDICLVLKKEDHLPRAEPTIFKRKIKLAPQQMALIKRLEREFVINVPDGTEIEAKTAVALSSMLLQMASGCVYETQYLDDWDTEDLKKVKKVHHLHDHKLDALREIVEAAEVQGAPLLVSYFWKSTLARLKKTFPKAVVMDKAGKCIKPWSAGKIPILLIHPQSAGHGLNLQYGGSTLIFFDLIYSLEYFLQTIGRIDRQGQTKPVLVELLVAEGTRDEDCFASLALKQDGQEKFFRILKRLIREHKKDRMLH